ncbi:MAG: hypothetical protein BGO10_02150 [Chlamydia sp. 32-24]|nr:MAG: hypothetical protein BGO10_02150 [Chlamydia sp. 32-24]
MNMKALMGFLGAALMAVSFLTAAPARGPVRTNCQCQNCHCTPSKHCGCFSQAGCHCSYNCQCSDNCACGDNCSCGSGCNCG